MSTEYYPTIAQAAIAFTGRTLGPNKYTGYGEARITSFTHVAGSKTWTPVVSITYHPPVMHQMALRQIPAGTSWWNPATWDWGQMLYMWGAPPSVNAARQRCWSGALKGFVTYLVGGAVNLLLDLGKLVLDVGGFAAIALGECILGIIFGSG